MLFLLCGIASIRGLIAKLGFNSQIEIFLGHAPINSTTQKIPPSHWSVHSPIFFREIVVFDGPPSWSPDARGVQIARG